MLPYRHTLAKLRITVRKCTARNTTARFVIGQRVLVQPFGLVWFGLVWVISCNVQDAHTEMCRCFIRGIAITALLKCLNWDRQVTSDGRLLVESFLRR